MISNTRKLVQDPYGNYVVQYLLDLRRPELTLGIALGLQGAFVELSLQKFSSNVIEKCLRAGDGGCRRGRARRDRARRRLATAAAEA